MKEGIDTSRRGFLKDGGRVATVAALASTPVYGVAEVLAAPIASEPVEWANIVPDPVHAQEGDLVLVDDLMRQSIPMPDPEQILGTDTGLIISKRFHRFWLFDSGELLKTGPIGSAMVSEGLDTPEGKFDITRQEGENYSSREFPTSDPERPNMAWPSFFVGPRGIAFHGSTNFVTLKSQLNGEEKTLIRLDASHGCVNALKPDADLVRQTLGIGSTVVVLP